MTLKEAKKILEKEGFKLGGPGKPGKPGVVSEAFAEYESPEICEAMQIVCSAGFQLAMLAGVFDERKERLKKEYEKNTKAPGSGKEQPKEKKGIIYPTTFPKADFYYKHVLDEGNPALNESASQFNDALLDEQAKKIAELTKKNERLGKEIARLNKNIYKKNMKIEELRKESSRHLRGKIKMLGENVDLEQMLKDKNAILSDVAEELRLTKIREKNLAELGLKYVGENEELKKELADKVVDKINANALKSAESALAYKEKVIAEKNEVIADLGKELAAQKDLVDDISLKYDGAKHNLKLRMDECEKLKKELEEKTKLVETVRKGSKEYCEYGIAAEKMIRKMANVIVYEGKVSSKEFEEYRRWANGYRFNHQLYDFIEEEEKKRNAAKMVDINAKCMRAARESISDVFESYAAKYAKSSLDDLKEKAYELFNAKAHKLGLVGSKDGKGIPDQMIRVDIAEEGGDHSGKIVLCGKDFVKMLKENEDFIHDLFEKKYKEIKEVMSVESKQLFEGDGIPTKMEAVKPSQRFKQAVCDARLELLYFIS